MKGQSYLPTGGKKVFFNCSYCKRDITQQLRIQCAQCDNFDLCGDCFAAGVSRFPHENTHDYRVVDCIDIPIFTRDWTASEEILMLEGKIISSFSVFSSIMTAKSDRVLNRKAKAKAKAVQSSCR